MLAGMAAGAVNTAINGGNFGYNIGMGALFGGLAGGIGGELFQGMGGIKANGFDWANFVAAVKAGTVTGAALGGISTAINGGNFFQNVAFGALGGAMGSAIGYGVAYGLNKGWAATKEWWNSLPGTEGQTSQRPDSTIDESGNNIQKVRWPFRNPFGRPVPPPGQPLPPGWTPEWSYDWATRPWNGAPRWWDPQGGEWHFHAPDKWHADPHWNYNPNTHPSSPWQNIPLAPGTPGFVPPHPMYRIPELMPRDRWI